MWYRKTSRVIRINAGLLIAALIMLSSSCMTVWPTTDGGSTPETSEWVPSETTMESMLPSSFGPSPEPSPQPTPSGSSTPTPTLTPEPTPEPTPTATSAPTTGPVTPEPTVEPEPTTTPSNEPVPTTIAPTDPSTDAAAVYIVQPGDTLYRIATDHAIPMDVLIALNQITDPDLIYVGQVLLLRYDTGVNLDALDNTSRGWTYRVPSPLFQDVNASISADISRLIEPYGVIWQLPPNGQRTIYLTMDAGYEYHGNTARILTIAADQALQLTFFVTGSLIQHEPALVRRMVEDGHQVGNHTERHLNQPLTLQTSVDLVINDILAAEQRMIELTGQSLTPYLRPPSGAYSERSLALIRLLGYRAVFWSFAYSDWQVDQQPDPQVAYDHIMGQLHDGSVLLLHTVSDTNVQIFAQLIDGIRARGYTIAPLP